MARLVDTRSQEGADEKAVPEYSLTRREIRREVDRYLEAPAEEDEGGGRGYLLWLLVAGAVVLGEGV